MDHFPICDHLGGSLGSGANNSDGHPKYLQYHQNPVFHKSTYCLWAQLDEGCHQRGKPGCRGGIYRSYFLVSKGVRNVLASLGTAFTSAHAPSEVVTEHVTIAFDGDQAGQQRSLLQYAALSEAGAECPGGAAAPGGFRQFARSHREEDVQALA